MEDMNFIIITITTTIANVLSNYISKLLGIFKYLTVKAPGNSGPGAFFNVVFDLYHQLLLDSQIPIDQ